MYLRRPPRELENSLPIEAALYPEHINSTQRPKSGL
jgi:hypothetical protein